MSRTPTKHAAALFACLAALGLAVLSGLIPPWLVPLPRWLLWALTVTFAGLAVHEIAGRPIPLLRWSFLRMVIGIRRLLTEWQVGDGREEACARHVLATAPAGDVDAAIAAIDEFAYERKYLINVGDVKGRLLDDAVRRVQPALALELGAYVGYSALRIARLLPPGGRLVSIEPSVSNATIARRIAEHAGVADRVTFVIGRLDDGGKTLRKLEEEHGLGPGRLDLVFLDHEKTQYLPDLKRLLEAGFLRPGSVVVADNVGFPGAPDYQAYMEEQEGRRWRTQVHETHAEYQSLFKDLVLESTLLE